MTALTFVVPMPPTLTNSGAGRSRHWRVLEREKRSYWAALDLLSRASSSGIRRLLAAQSSVDDVLAAGALVDGFSLPAAPPAPLARARVTSSMVLGGAMDDDNAMARHKWLIDWLVANGYLVSDRRTCLRWAALPEQRVSRKEPARITLTLTPEP